ncbi:MAG: DUF2442 domain-containing protein [Pelodictyon phaeoclathratiforme]
MNSLLKTPWVQVVEVISLSGMKLKVRLTNGQELTLNLEPLIESRDAYWRLRQEKYFRQVSIDPIGGICWPEGEDLAPDGLERYVCQ